MKKPTKKQLKPYWKELSKLEDEFGDKVHALELLMKKELGKDLEFFICDGIHCGVGNEDRSMKLIHREYE